MSVRRRVRTYWTEVKRIVFDGDGLPQVQETTCCCGATGGLRRICARVSGNTTPCRCACHANVVRRPARVLLPRRKTGGKK